MHPTLFRFAGYAVSTYGAIVAGAVLAGGHVFGRGLEQRGIHRDVAWTLLLYALAGAFVGAKLYYAALHGDPEPSSLGLVSYGTVASWADSWPAPTARGAMG